MAIYTTQADASEPDAQGRIVLTVEIYRDDQLVATFAGRFPPAVADDVILNEIEKRVQGFVDADANRIAKEELILRANAIADSLDDRVW